MLIVSFFGGGDGWRAEGGRAQAQYSKWFLGRSDHICVLSKALKSDT